MKPRQWARQSSKNHGTMLIGVRPLVKILWNDLHANVPKGIGGWEAKKWPRLVTS